MTFVFAAVVVEAVEELAVHVRAVAGVRGLTSDVAALHDLDDRQAELLRERVIALVVRGAREHRAGAVAREHVVGDPDRDLLAVDRVDRERAGQHAGLRRIGRLVGAIALAALADLLAIRRDRRLLRGRRDLIDERMLGREHDVRAAEQRVGARREHGDRRPRVRRP